MTHAEMNELYELYALGALETELALEIDGHVVDQCSYCIEHIQEALDTTAALAGLSQAIEPPREVRQRILAAVAPSPVRQRSWWMAIPVLVAACLALLAVSLWSTGELNATRNQLAQLSGERDQLRSALEILSRSQTRTVKFGTSDQVAHGRLFINPRGGFVVVGSDLPALAQDRVFQLWLVPPKGAPQSAGLFRTGSTGNFVHVSNEPVDSSTIAAVAVSVEPLGGSKAPTTTPLLVVPLA